MRRSDRSPRLLASALLALPLIASSTVAEAYCRTSSCPETAGVPQHTSQVCVPAQSSDCGLVIAWRRACVGWSLQKDASAKVSFAEMEPVMAKAFQKWMSASCTGGGNPAITVKEADPASCTLHEYNQDKGNANIIVFRDASWPYAGTVNILALTTVTYNLEDGEIYDADMELNSAQTNFTLGDTAVDFDLDSIVTHEAGHFLGMAHSGDQDATMWPDYKPHTTNLRDLSPDDIAGICAIYPPGSNAGACDTTPRHGFSVNCASEQPAGGDGGGGTETGGGTSGGGCSTGRAGTSGSAWSLLVAGIGVFAARRARARRK